MDTRVTRRVMLGAAASLAGAALVFREAEAEESSPRLRLRLLETSDLHMFVLDWDYYHAKLDPTAGLARTATLIRKARAEVENSLLFDNGDFLQGNPLADFIAAQPLPSPKVPHPLMEVMSGLGYDTIGLGNHEFNYGLEFLEATLSGAAFPVVCANVTRADGRPFLPPYTILKRQVKDESGTLHELRIGVIGFVPPQIMMWDKTRLEGKIAAIDIVTAAKRYLPELRAACDVTVALSHSGIRTGEYTEGEENASFHLASVPGIDLIMTGHSHRVFPGKDYANLEGVDPAAGRLNGVPAIMPGFWGSHLGVADLVLKREGGRWAIEDAKVETRPIYRREQGKVEELATRDSAVSAAIAPAHQRTLAWVEQPVGTIGSAVHSYFVWAGYDPATALVNAAQTWYVHPLLDSAGLGGLPLLSSASPFKAGYTPDSFIDMEPGPVPLRSIADLYSYSSNTVMVVKVSGAQILEWLEYAARAFNTIDPSAQEPQALVNKHIPSYNFDIIAGLTYTIDVTKPPRYDARGTLNANSHRIGNLRFKGEPLGAEREFAVVTNSYRADGGGNFPALSAAKILLRAPDTNRDAILRYFRAQETVRVQSASPWTFAEIGRSVPVYFDTGKPAATRLRDVQGLVLQGDGEPGYLRAGLTLA